MGQEVAWRRSQSKGVRKYKFKIKKENERCLEYLVEDQKYLVEDHDPEEENIKFTIPLAFQDGVEYRVNVYSLAEHEGMVVESEPCHVKAFREYENAEFFEEGRGQAVINLVSPKEMRSGSARQLDAAQLGRFGSQTTLLEELVSAGPMLRIPVSRQRRLSEVGSVSHFQSKYKRAPTPGIREGSVGKLF